MQGSGPAGNFMQEVAGPCVIFWVIYLLASPGLPLEVLVFIFPNVLSLPLESQVLL